MRLALMLAVVLSSGCASRRPEMTESMGVPRDAYGQPVLK